jgi:hypothetical protein
VEVQVNGTALLRASHILLSALATWVGLAWVC